MKYLIFCFDLPSRNDKWCWASLDVLVYLLWRNACGSLALIFELGDLCIFFLEVYKYNMLFRSQSHLSCVIYKDFFLSYAFPFHFVDDVLCHNPIYLTSVAYTSSIIFKKPNGLPWQFSSKFSSKCLTVSGVTLGIWSNLS